MGKAARGKGGKSGKGGKGGARSPSPSPSSSASVPRAEAAEITALIAALAPVVAARVSHHRIGSAAGVHPEDMKGFLEGRLTLTAPLRARLREAIPNLVRNTPADPAED